MGYVVMAAMIVTGIVGFYFGWLVGGDRAESRQLGQRAAAAELAVKGRHARAWPRTTGELAAVYGAPYPQMNGASK